MTAIEIGNFTRILLDADIDPLVYMNDIPPYTFYSSGIGSIDVPDNVKSIKDCGFTFCRSLTRVTGGSSVKSIGDHAFAYCSSLTSIKIPNNVTSIGNYAFSGCGKLTNIEYEGTMEQLDAISKSPFWKYNVPQSCIVHCIDGDIKLW